MTLEKFLKDGHDLLDVFPFGVLVVDGKREIQYYNTWVKEEFYHQKGSLYSKRLDSIWPEGPLSQCAPHWTSLEEYKTRDYSKHLLISCKSLEPLEGMVIFFQELKTLKAIDKELERLKRLKINLELILNSIEEGVHVVNERGETVFYNEQAASRDGLKVDDVLGKNLLDVYPSLTEKTSTLIRTLLSKETVAHKQQTYFNYQGKMITTVNKTIPIQLNGESIGALEISRDITQIKEIVEKVVDLQQELTKKKRGVTGSHKKDWTKRYYTLEDIKGSSPQIKEAIERAKKVMAFDSPLLLVGETGTGKELFAQSIHYGSHRRDRPFIGQNCAALPKDLLEGILFGTVKGGFTGAVNRPGIFEQAHGGTLLLDEIHMMDLDLQIKLLRVLQEKSIRPLGGQREISVDIRFIATMDTYPQKYIQEGRLRQDLYYRLAVAQIHLPPLRERTGDILVLLQYFIEKYCQKMKRHIAGLSQNLIHLFLEYDWPGNVRELEHVIEGIFNFIDDGKIVTREDLPLHMKEESIFKIKEEKIWQKTLGDMVESFERDIIVKALREEKGVKAKAAKKLGVKRQTLQYKIQKYGLI